VDISNNCWCTNDSAEIANTIYDGYDDVSLGILDFVPFLSCDSTAIPSSLFVNCSITASSDTICEGEEVVFIALSENGGNNPSYEWYLNGSPAGTNDSVFICSSCENGDEVYCILSSSENCLINNPATSETITITVNSPPFVNIIAQPNDTVCLQEIVTLDAGIENETYLWSNGDTTQQISVTNTSGPQGGLQSYWLFVSDSNSCQAIDSIDVYFDPCLSLLENYKQIKLDVFPNPSAGMFMVEIKGMIKGGYLSLTDIDGNLIMNKKISSNNDFLDLIDLTNELPGIYVVFIKTKDGKIRGYQKIVKL